MRMKLILGFITASGLFVAAVGVGVFIFGWSVQQVQYPGRPIP